MGVWRQQGVNLLNGGDGRRQGTAVIVAVEGVEKGSVFSHQGGLRRRGAGVNTEIAVAGIGGQVALLDLILALALEERIEIFLIAEEGFQPLYFELHLNFAGELIQKFGSVQYIYAHLEELDIKPAMKQKLANSKDNAFSS